MFFDLVKNVLILFYFEKNENYSSNDYFQIIFFFGETLFILVFTVYENNWQKNSVLLDEV
jgi:hypothetical protein